MSLKILLYWIATSEEGGTGHPTAMLQSSKVRLLVTGGLNIEIFYGKSYRWQISARGRMFPVTQVSLPELYS